MAFVQKHLPDPFYLEGTNRISIRDAIFREVASNILIHREYRNAFPAKLIIERGQVRTENSNKPHGFGVLDPNTFTPYPKNPVIGAFFREIHRADELGSGMRNMMRYGKAYGGEDPQMIEGDVFRIIVKVPEYGSFEEQNGKKDSGQVTGEVTGEVQRLVQSIRGEMSRAEIQREMKLKHEDYFREAYLMPALNSGLIEMTIPDKPRSSKQKYRLTSKGYDLLNKMK
jgi:ATP-dependent DNA helicase RecG